MSETVASNDLPADDTTAPFDGGTVVDKAGPTEADHDRSDRMFTYLESTWPAETAEGMQKRQALLASIEELVNNWTSQLADGGSDDSWKAKIATFGSHSLGVVHPGSDIDTLCLCPLHVTRGDFFTKFVAVLEAHDGVTELSAISEAYTPVLKFKLHSISIDLLFVQLPTPLPEGDKAERMLMADEILKDLDEMSARCVNGYRVAHKILKLVPNQATFRQTLHFIKYWARRRMIYSNVLGYFGGITWSLLVARVCQLHPNALPSTLVCRFFSFFHQWNWSRPVCLCDIDEPTQIPGMAAFKVWNPRNNVADAQHLMPVITPAFPAMNSTHNVTETTKRIMMEEFRRAYEIAEKVESGQADWNDVNEQFPFFSRFDDVLALHMYGATDEVLLKFSRWVESKFRVLIWGLEALVGVQCHPNPVLYAHPGIGSQWPCGCVMYLAVEYRPDRGALPGMNVNFTDAARQFITVLGQWSKHEALTGRYMFHMKRMRTYFVPKLYGIDAPEFCTRTKRPRDPSPPPVGSPSQRHRSDLEAS